MTTPDTQHAWPGATLTRIPFWVYQDEDNYRAELRRIFEGPAWNYVCLEADLAQPGDYRTTFVGEMPIVVVRGEHGAIHAFENRCAHRGALIALDDGGTAKHFQCVYHAWSYDLRGNLTRHRLREGHQRPGRHAPSPSARPSTGRESSGPPHSAASSSRTPVATRRPTSTTISARRSAGASLRVMHKPVEVLGRFVQVLPNNWKLYFENVKDTYHASLLHAFFGTFRITRLTQGGRRAREPRTAAHHASYTIDRADDRASTAYRDQGIRSEKSSYRLADPSLLDTVDEFGDGIKLQILSVFPNLVVQQIYNCLAVRQVLPKGPDAMELHWTYIGFADDDAEMRAPAPPAGQPGRPRGLRVDGGRLRGRLRPARRRGRRRRSVRGQHGRRGRRVPGDARHRGLGARLLEGVPALHGDLT